MEYRLRIGEQIHAVQGDGFSSSEPIQVQVGGVSRRVRAEAIDEHHIVLNVDGATVNVYVATEGEETWVWVGGRQRRIQDADAAVPRKRSAAARVPNEVTPPTPATVMRVTAEIGQEVKTGQPLVVVSAMKMEITLGAPYPGVVTAIHTEAGAQVRPGDILVEIERAKESETNE